MTTQAYVYRVGPHQFRADISYETEDLTGDGFQDLRPGDKLFGIVPFAELRTGWYDEFGRYLGPELEGGTDDMEGKSHEPGTA